MHPLLPLDSAVSSVRTVRAARCPPRARRVASVVERPIGKVCDSVPLTARARFSVGRVGCNSGRRQFPLNG